MRHEHMYNVTLWHVSVQSFLGAFVLSKHVHISFVMSVCPHVSALLSLDGFSWNFMLQTLMKICVQNPNLVKIRQNYQALYMKISVHF
jgi:hypothetical protein